MLRHSNPNDLRRQFESCLRYQRAAPWRKVFLNPTRFLRNQLRSRNLPFRRPGDTSAVAAFHLPEFTVVNGESVSEGLAAYGIYEAELTEAFLRLVGSGQVVADIGMHLGYYTTLFAQLVGEQGQVHAFEPTPSTRNIAEKNVLRFANVTVHPQAVWSCSGQMTFHDYGPAHLAFNSFAEARLAGVSLPSKEFTVQTLSLDEFRIQLGAPLSLVKVDAESAERRIIEGARETLRSDRPLVSLEVGDFDDGRASSGLLQLMAEHGYAPWELRQRRFTRHVPQVKYDYDNLIFAPLETDLSRC